MRYLLASAAAIALCAPALGQEINVPAGTYGLDATHASVTFRVMHFGLARYTARFTDIDATLVFDPENPENISLTAEVNPASIETDYDDIDPARRRDVDFDEELRSERFLGVAEFPTATFQSTSVTVLEDEGEDGDEDGGGLARASVEGDLTLHGVTLPVTFEVTLNGALEEHPFAGVAALGFSGYGVIDRSAFGVEAPPPVGTEVELLLEAEFFEQPA